ncbi:hypothetical protein AVEN_12526-1 [Araneus ventricosus]|uniref:Uncharacterized protein n=1 Tax=Araneus ventricosus TaxID=182803 RepID=A0A4Y2IMP2_ARAVE|nr:hypothetical protein AVEN_12526-1 [Araneus ventricosus]
MTKKMKSSTNTCILTPWGQSCRNTSSANRFQKVGPVQEPWGILVADSILLGLVSYDLNNNFLHKKSGIIDYIQSSFDVKVQSCQSSARDGDQEHRVANGFVKTKFRSGKDSRQTSNFSYQGDSLITQLFSALPKSEPRSRLPYRFFTAFLSFMSNTPVLFVPEGVELRLPFFPLDNRNSMRPTTKHLFPQ